MDLETDVARNDARSSSPMSSPIQSTRRFAQYKSRTSGSSIIASRSKVSRGPNFQVEEPPQKQLWREKLRVQVEKRAKRDREKAYERARSEGASSGASSEADYDMDDEDGDELDDELYRRVMIEERRKLAHHSRISYEREIGDPDDIYMEDVEGLEQEFAGSGSQQGVSAPTSGESEEVAALEEDPERIYQAYMAALAAQEQEEDEFEEEFDDIDPKVLEAMVA